MIGCKDIYRTDGWRYFLSLTLFPSKLLHKRKQYYDDVTKSFALNHRRKGVDPWTERGRAGGGKFETIISA